MPSASESRAESEGGDENATVGVSAPTPHLAEAMVLDRIRSRMLGAPEVTRTFGRYVLIEEIGRGAMGRVLRAYDPKLQREVALKEVRHDALDADATSRLVAEARAMAKLSHPHVVAVYDVEELDDDQVVLVMEFVAGQTLGAWRREQDRQWLAVVEHFIPAGRGLAAAHAAGLLHRDFKPDNVLVSEQGVVKVTDFGLAKRPGGEATESSLESVSSAETLTEAGTVLGTPRYMAPEQHDGSTLTAAADQYAFSVALWESLCGEPPFSGASMALDKYSGPPQWPRSGVPQSVVQAVERGLAPAPEDRWPSMEALLEALAWDPVRRRARGILAVAGLGIVGISGVSYGAWAGVQAERCSGGQEQLAGAWDASRREAVDEAMEAIDRPYAEGARVRTLAALDGYSTDWIAAHTETCEATTIRGEQSSDMMDLRMACLQRAAQDLDAAVDVLVQADAEVVQRAHRITGGLPPLSRCADTEALTADVEPPLPAEAEAVGKARARLTQARALLHAGRYEDAQRAVEDAKTIQLSVEYGPLATEVALREGVVLQDLGEYDAAEAALNEAVRSGAKWHQWEVMSMAATDLIFLVGGLQKDVERALEHRAVAQGLVEGNPRAEAAFRNNLAAVFDVQGRYPEAETEYRAAIALYRTIYGPEHQSVAGSRDNLGLVLEAQGNFAEAEAEHRAVIALFETALGPDHPDVAPSRSNLALALESQGKYAEAEAELRTAVATLEAAPGPDHPEVAGPRGNLAAVLHAQNKYAEAEAEHRAAIAALAAALGPDHLDVATARSNLAVMLLDQEEYGEAEAEHRAALAIYERALGPEHPDVAMARTDLADVLISQGRPDEALPLAEASWARHLEEDVLIENRAYVAFVLARALWSAKERDRGRARQLAEEALAAYREAGEVFASQVERTEQWLRTHD